MALALGAFLAAEMTVMGVSFAAGLALSILGYSLIGVGVGAAGGGGHDHLADDDFRHRGDGGGGGQSAGPLCARAAVEAGGGILAVALRKRRAPLPFRQGLAEIWQESKARNFTLFSLLSMTAYFMQELILKPYAGLAFGNTPGQSNQLSGAQNGGVFVGMLLVGIAATGLRIGSLRASVMAGCGGSLMALASAGRAEREGTRMGFWGATQAIAAGFGGLIESAVVDLAWSGVAVAFLDRAGRIKPSGEAIPPRWLSLAGLDAQVQVDPARFTPWMRIYLAEGWRARARVPVSAR